MAETTSRSAPTIASALDLLRRGHRQAAERVCEDILRQSGEDPDVLTLLSEMQATTGRFQLAAASLARVIELRPGDAAAQRRYAGACVAAGDRYRARRAWERAIDLEPANARAHNNLGQLLLQSGHPQAAIESLDRAVALDGRYAAALCNRGMALVELGRFTEAVTSYHAALAADPTLAEAHFNCGNVLRRLQRHRDAIECYDRAIELRPRQAEPRMARASLLHELRRFEQALTDYDRVIELHPSHAVAWSNRANALLELKRAEEALESCERALALDPGLAEAYNNRAGILKHMRRDSEALAACDRALELDPACVDAWCNRGVLLEDLGELESARECYAKALALDADCLKARLRRVSASIPAIARCEADILASRAALEAELSALEKWLPDARVSAGAASDAAGQLFYLSYQEKCNREFLVRFRRIAAELLTRAGIGHRGFPAPAGDHARARLRLGIVSAHIFDHSVYKALVEGWLKRLDPNRIEVQLFHVGARRDTDTVAASALAERFEAQSRTLEEWISTLRESCLDTLIYPEVGMDGLTLRLAGLRLAPHQAAAWGHPETTGLGTIDSFLSAEGFEPDDGQSHYSERLVRLPRLGCHYEAYGIAASPVDLAELGTDGEGPVFLCPGVPFKYAPQHDRLLPEIARRVGPCRFVFFEWTAAGLSHRLKERLRAAFAERGLDASRYLRSIPWQPRPRFLGLLQAADVCLDTIGFSGFNTVMQAAECALPCVTFEGRFLRGRLGSAIMRQVGLPELVATDPAGYVEIAVRLATDAGWRTAIRTRLRDGLPSVLADPAPVAALADYLSESRRA